MEVDHHRKMRVGGLELRFLVDETQGSGDLIVFEYTIPPNVGVAVAPHSHSGVDEFMYGISGTVTSTVDGKPHEVRPGESLFIPRGCPHYHANLSAEVARGVAVMNPGTIGRRYFEEIAALVNGPGQPDVARVTEVMLRYGTVPA
jgi:quercetin dioxygenase-like cupin family protein